MAGIKPATFPLDRDTLFGAPQCVLNMLLKSFTESNHVTAACRELLLSLTAPSDTGHKQLSPIKRSFVDELLRFNKGFRIPA